MKRAAYIWLVLLGGSLHAEIIDRIAASVDTRVITQSEVERQIRVAAFQDGEKPDLSTRSKEATLQSLIDQRLIRLDQENSHYPQADPAELVPVIEQFKKDHFANEAEYRRALIEYGIADKDFRDLLLWQRTLISFIDVRFRTGETNEAEISDYFGKVVKPAAQAAHPGQPVQLEDYRAQIETKLAAERADRQLDDWLRAARRRTQIVVHEEALK